MGLFKILAALVGNVPTPISVAPPRAGADELREEGDGDGDDSPFAFYNSFQLADARILIEALEKVEIPFEVEFDDGIRDVNFNFGSGGGMAKVTFYVEPENHPEVDELVRLYFH